MNLFVFEHVCGGGMNGQPIPDEWAAQGAAMLSAVIRDLLDADVSVTTTCDVRIHLPVTKANVVPVDGGSDLDAQFDQLASQADATLVIAPETGDLLERWCRRLEALSACSLGSSPQAVRLCGDKLATAQWLHDAGVPTPETRLAREAMTLGRPGSDSSFSVVVKPRDGAGCEQTSLYEFDKRAPPMSALNGDDNMIVQRFVLGTCVSVSVIVHHQSIQPLPAGLQRIDRHVNQLTYQGGHLPLSDMLQCRATNLATRAVNCVPNLRGFVGVDLILADDERDDTVIEINPRLTVSYVGLSALCQTNLARAILDVDAPLAWRPGALRFDAAGAIAWERMS